MMEKSKKNAKRWQTWINRENQRLCASLEDPDQRASSLFPERHLMEEGSVELTIPSTGRLCLVSRERVVEKQKRALKNLSEDALLQRQVLLVHAGEQIPQGRRNRVGVRDRKGMSIVDEGRNDCADCMRFNLLTSRDSFSLSNSAFRLSNLSSSSCSSILAFSLLRGSAGSKSISSCLAMSSNSLSWMFLLLSSRLPEVKDRLISELSVCDWRYPTALASG